MLAKLQEKVLRRKQMGNSRSLENRSNLIDFSSNDYLGIARSEQFKRMLQTEIATFDLLGSTGSRLLTGNSLYVEKLEDKIANFHCFETGLLFNCGYMANVGLISAVADENDQILFDSGVHASMRDGIYLSRATAFPFKHNETEHLEKRLKNCRSKGERFICIESIYSTDGSEAPLIEIVQLAKQYNAHLIVDEAHAVGVLGKSGRGLVEERGLTHQVFAVIVTFGKALGAFGAAVLGSLFLKEALIQFSHAFIYTTALPFYSLAAIKCSYDLFPQLENERSKLKELIQFLHLNGIRVSNTHIQPISVKGNKAAKEISNNLYQQGIDLRALLSPTVRSGSEILRLCLHAFNSKMELIKLLERLRCVELW